MKKLLLSILIGLFSFTFSFADQIFKIKVDGMLCKMCPLAVKKSLKQVKGVKKVKVDFNKKLAVVKAENFVKPQELLNAIKKASKYTGHKYKGKILKIEKGGK